MNTSHTQTHRYPPDKPCPVACFRGTYRGGMGRRFPYKVKSRKARYGERWWQKRCHSRRSRAWHREECREVLNGRHVAIAAEAEIRAQWEAELADGWGNAPWLEKPTW